MLIPECLLGLEVDQPDELPTAALDEEFGTTDEAARTKPPRRR